MGLFYAVIDLLEYQYRNENSIKRHPGALANIDQH